MSRTRSISTTEPAVACTVEKYSAHTAYADPTHMMYVGATNTSYIPASYEKVMTDTVTPNFYRRSAQGEVIVNSLDVVETRYLRTPVLWDRVAESRYLFRIYDGKWHETYGIGSGWSEHGEFAPEYMLGTTFLSAPSVNNVSDIAVTGSFAKANEQDAQGLVILAEGEKTVKSFISIGWRLFKILRALRRWDVGWLARQFTPKELADRWMEGRYAIRPVIYDAMDCIKAAQRNLAQNPARKTYRSGASDTSTVTQTGVLTKMVTGDYKMYATLQTVRNISARAGVLAAIDEVTAVTSWGLNQPFTALWELLPFSFVVDWFFNVGKTIASWSPQWGMRTLASWVTVVDTVISSIVCEHTEDLYTAAYQYGLWESYVHGSGGSIIKTETTKTRRGSPYRSVLPSFTVRLDWAKFLDLAIMAKRFLR